MQLSIRIELAPEATPECCYRCPAISVTVDGIKQETYNSAPTVAEPPKEEKEEEEKKEDYAEEEKETQS